MTGALVRLGLVCDLREELWPSMDLMAERLEHHLRLDHGDAIEVESLCPPFTSRFSRAAGDLRGPVRTVDRLLNRYLDYPRQLLSGRVADRFDLFHIVDHSYAHLVEVLPAGRVVVTCHDLDAFQATLAPMRHPNPVLRALARRTLRGLRAAARVVCDSEVVRSQLLAHRLVSPDRIAVIPLGVHPTRSPAPDAAADAAAGELLGPLDPTTVELLHVGSTIPRKRVDRLLRVFAAVAAREPGARLVRVGGPFTRAQEELANSLGIGDRVRTLPFLTHPMLSAVYRRAALVLLTSDSEGFGLPVVEALGSGTPVVASDLPVLREVGGAAVSYCHGDDLDDWARTVIGLLHERGHGEDDWRARREAGLRHAASFSWRTCANRLVDLYQEIHGPVPGRATASSGAARAQSI